MTTFSGGTITAHYTIDYSQAQRAAQQIKQLYQSIGQQQAAQSRGSGAQQLIVPANQDRQILAVANAQARLAQVQNTGANAARGLAQAEQIYQTALAKVDQTQVGAIRTATQLAAVQNRLAAQAGGGLPVLPRTVEAFGTQAIDQFKAGILGLVGPAAVASAAIAAIPQGLELAKLGAQAEQTRVRFDQLAAAAGISGDALLAALRKGSGGEISDLNLQLAANKAQLLGVAHSAEEFGVLMAIARDRAQQMGISTTQAFDDLVTGLGRGSRLILDNLGILVNADAANEAYARSIGKTVSALTDQERKQALINQVLKDGQATIAATGGAVESNAAKIARGQAAFDNLKASIGGLLALQIGPFADDMAKLLNAAQGVDEALAGFSGFTNIVARGNPAIALFRDIGKLLDQTIVKINQASGLQLPDIAAPARVSLQAYRDLLIQIGLLPQAQAEVGKAAIVLGDTMESARAREVAATNAARDSAEAYRAIEARNVANSVQATQAQLGYATALEQTGVQQRAAALAAQQKSTADKVAAIDAQTHAVAEAQLDARAKAAAASLLAAGPAGARTAALLAGSSQQVDILTAAYYRLAAATQQAAKPPQTDLQKGLSALRSASIRTAEDISAANVKALTAETEERQRKAKEAADREKQLTDLRNQNRLINARSTTAKVAELERQLRGTNDPVERQRLINQIDQERLSGARAITAEANKQLSLEERIRDSKIDQLRSALGAQKAAAQDTLDRLKEQQEIAKAQRILNNPNARGDIRQAAQARIDLITADQKLRQLDIAEKQATAGGAIINGRIIQGRQIGAGQPVGAVPVPTGQAIPVGSSAAQGGAGSLVVVFQVGTKEVAREIIPEVVASLHRGFNQSISAG